MCTTTLGRGGEGSEEIYYTKSLDSIEKMKKNMRKTRK